MEITANAVQTVQPNQDVLFTNVAVEGNLSMLYRPGSGLVGLRGITRGQYRARYKVSFGANIAIPTGGTAGPISLAIALEGEPINSSQMIVTPAAVEEYFNVHGEAYIDVPVGCCIYASVRNTTATAVDVQNANFIVERVA